MTIPSVEHYLSINKEDNHITWQKYVISYVPYLSYQLKFKLLVNLMGTPSEPYARHNAALHEAMNERFKQQFGNKLNE